MTIQIGDRHNYNPHYFGAIAYAGEVDEITERRDGRIFYTINQATQIHVIKRVEMLYAPKTRITAPSFFCFDTIQELLVKMSYEFKNIINKDL